MTPQLLALAALLALCGPSHAGYAAAQPPAGWSPGGGAGGSIVVRSGAAANAARYVAGSVVGNVTVPVAGRAIVMPMAARVAANAGAVVMTAARFHPAAGIALGVATAAWFAAHNLEWNDSRKKWEVVHDYEDGWEWSAYTNEASLGYVGWHASKSSACSRFSAWYQTVTGACADGLKPPARGVLTANGGDGLCIVEQQACVGSGTGWVQVSSTGMAKREAGGSQSRRDATEGDFDGMRNEAPPDGVPDEVGVPVPMEMPRINPGPDGNPQPSRVPMGDPTIVPGSNPLVKQQPAVDVVPSSTAAEPWRVDLRPVELTWPAAEPVPTEPYNPTTGDPIVPWQPGDPVPGTDPGTSPGTGTAPVPVNVTVTVPPQKQLCEVYPNSSACAELGTAEDGPEVPNVNKPFVLTPWGSFGPSSASCPAPRVLNLQLAGTVSMEFDLYCSFASGIRGVVLALAWLGAIGIAVRMYQG